MSTLTKALNRILKWLQQYRPLDVSFLNPGLSVAEIEEIVKKLPVRLPKEVYELYQWRNGTIRGTEDWEFSCTFDWWGFVPLQFARVEHKLRSNNYREPWPVASDSFYSLNIFFSVEPIDEGFVVIDETLKPAPVCFQSCKAGGCSSIAKYASLTTMMLTIADCYENAYYVDAAGNFTQDTYRVQIWRKYNSSQIVKAALTRLNQEIWLELLVDVEDDLMLAKHARAVEPLIQILQKPIFRDEDSCFQGLAIRVLGELGDARAVAPLIHALQDEDWMTRYRAARSLGNLGDERAIAPLIQLLQDSQNEVQLMAERALRMLKAVEPLIQALNHPDVDVRIRAASALGKIKDSRAIEPLSQLSEDADSSVRQAVKRALFKLKQKN